MLYNIELKVHGGTMTGLAFLLSLISQGFAGNVDISYFPTIGKGEKPTVYLTPDEDVTSITVTIRIAGKTYEFTEQNQSAGQEMTFSWQANPNEIVGTAEVKAVFSSGYVGEMVMPMEFSYGGSLAVDYGSVLADSAKKELRVTVTDSVAEAEIISYGAEKMVLDRKTLVVGAGPGEIILPWVGDVEDTVLLDITLRNESSFAGFTYSPWFMDIPHQDVLFDTDRYAIQSEEEWKLEDTMKELTEVLRKYGSVVPVKLYIAGCTDTVGDQASNRRLSEQRAKAIASWLRGHGYDQPIYYYGFGESLPAIKTADGVDEPKNRRVLYIVTSDRPSDLPSVSWKSLP